MKELMLSAEEIMEILPHRYPMLLLDQLKQVVLGESAIGIKNVTVNEPFFLGHFPQKPVMPGVLIIEAMAQTAAALVMKTLGITHQNHLVYFMSIHNARFRKPVYPGDRLELFVQKKHTRGAVWKFSGKAYVDQQEVAEALYAAMITPR
jgi:3-hydroxyacyl-[acyl-carrier-protein] dehydratase